MGLENRKEVERRLMEFILVELLEEPFRGEDPLSAGAVDSLGIEQLVQYISEAFEVDLPEEEIVWDNFETVPRLAALVESRRGCEREAP